MIRLLKYFPVVLSIIGVIRKSRKDAALKTAKTSRKRTSHR
jgi:hypothetical protein